MTPSFHDWSFSSYLQIYLRSKEKKKTGSHLRDGDKTTESTNGLYRLCLYPKKKNKRPTWSFSFWGKNFSFFLVPYCWWWCGLLWPVLVKLRIKTWWKMFLWRLNRPVITWFSLSVVPLSLSVSYCEISFDYHSLTRSVPAVGVLPVYALRPSPGAGISTAGAAAESERVRNLLGILSKLSCVWWEAKKRSWAPSFLFGIHIIPTFSSVPFIQIPWLFFDSFILLRLLMGTFHRQYILTWASLRWRRPKRCPSSRRNVLSHRPSPLNRARYAIKRAGQLRRHPYCCCCCL